MDYIGNELELFKNAKNWKKYFSKYLSKHISGDVLEVGAGNGVNSNYLFNSSCGSWTFVEPDINLKNKIIENTSGIQNKRIICGTIDNAEVEKIKYDTILYIDVLEHIQLAELEIEKAMKLLKPQGKLIILVPSYQFLYNNFDLKIGHIKRYNKKILKKEINNHLHQEKLFYLDSLGLLASLINKVFLKQDEITIKQVLFWDRIIIRISKFSDLLVFKLFGKSLIGVFQKKSK